MHLSVDPSGPRALLANDSSLHAVNLGIDRLRELIGGEVQTMPHLGMIREYNRSNLEAIAQQFVGSRADARMLDIGGSIHGFALEMADELGFREYIGIDLDVKRHWKTNLLNVVNGERRHILCQMDAHRLWFEDESMDLVVSLSGFEHYLFPEHVLGEMLRVLKKGGVKVN